MRQLTFLVKCLALPWTVVLMTSCNPPNIAGSGLEAPTLGAAFSGVQCSAVRQQTEPDLMAWDPGSRANLTRLRKEGIVAVRYSQEGCNVELEVLSNCIGPTAAYRYTSYAETKSKTARNANELFMDLPIGAAKLAGKLKGSRALRTDYMLVGMAALPASSSYHRADLKGASCARATHVVSVVYLGGFAMVAGEARTLEASVSVFQAGLGGGSTADLETLDRAGDPKKCKEAEASHVESAECSVPLRIALLPLEEDPGPPPPAPTSAPVSVPVTVAPPAPTSAPVSVSVTVAPPPPAASCPAGMVLIPGGVFNMGSSDADPAAGASEKPLHVVTVSTFCMAKTETTVAAYDACVTAGACKALSAPSGAAYQKYCNTTSRPTHPVNCVDWMQAGAYCAAQGSRLPTEEEWEYAARGVAGRTYPWGSDAPDQTRLNACGSECVDSDSMYGASDGWPATAPVGSFSRGATPEGLLDMQGNVTEWTSSAYCPYSNMSCLANTQASRGSSWSTLRLDHVRSATRGTYPSSTSSFIHGFRCAKTP